MTRSDFWSKRRAAVEAEQQAEQQAEAAALAQARAAEEEAALAARSDEDLLQEAGLPQPEALESSEEVQDFLKSALPQRLKTRALRRLWRLNPVLANVDGLVDYGEDYTDAALVVENMQTVYQVGKGMFDKFAKEIDAVVKEEDDRVAKQEVPEEVRDGEDMAPIGAAVDPGPADVPGPLAFTDPQEAPDVARSTARRMRFSYES